MNDIMLTRRSRRLEMHNNESLASIVCASLTVYLCVRSNSSMDAVQSTYALNKSISLLQRVLVRFRNLHGIMFLYRYAYVYGLDASKALTLSLMP